MDRCVFLQKLQRFGRAGSLIKSIASYLRMRVQPVKIGNYFSEELWITNLVPHGSVLDPIFPLALTNDLLEYCTCYSYVFADAVKLASSFLNDLQKDLFLLLT